jgi:hypothetical protein
MVALVVLCSADSRASDQPQTQPQTGPQTQTQPQTEVTVTYDIVGQGTYSGIKEPLQKVIQTKEEFADLWKQHVSVIVPQPPPPAVDFETSAVVAIYMGEKNTSGFQILIKRVEAQGNNVLVHFKQTEPPANSFTLQVLTQPFVLLRVDKPDGQVQLIKE